MVSILKKIGFAILVVFALLGLATTSVFFAMQYGLLNVRGSIMERNMSFGVVPKVGDTQSGQGAPSGMPGQDAQGTTTPEEPPDSGCIGKDDPEALCAWNETTSWEVVRDALTKDQAVILDVSQKTGVSGRMIVSAVIPEQLRFFSSNREVFKRYFEPLKLLVSLSKFSLGVSGIKQETAATIEQHANDVNSPFYPGPGYAELLAYAEGADHDTELFNRLTDEKNHYYSYLYTAIFLKEIEMHWQRAGYDVSQRPDVLVTLFNLGFNASEPKENPQVAGAIITQGGRQYSFGYLGTLFYQSEELFSTFPR